MGFPGGSVVKTPPANAVDMGSNLILIPRRPHMRGAVERVPVPQL